MFEFLKHNKVETAIKEEGNGGGVEVKEKITPEEIGVKIGDNIPEQKEKTSLTYTELIDDDALMIDAQKTFDLKNLWSMKIEPLLPENINDFSREEQKRIIKEIRAQVEGQQ
ncbi:MAG: hypothetical protein EOM85_00530 [Candidatus Moranbacteria bacterium]|nr:hypothetical protein [Candidatus Moranbacteria bacterium]